MQPARSWMLVGVLRHEVREHQAKGGWGQIGANWDKLGHAVQREQELSLQQERGNGRGG
jgi:hypothetical protein